MLDHCEWPGTWSHSLFLSPNSHTRVKTGRSSRTVLSDTGSKDNKRPAGTFLPRCSSEANRIVPHLLSITHDESITIALQHDVRRSRFDDAEMDVERRSRRERG